MSWHPGDPALVVRPPAAASLDEAHLAIEFWEHYSGKVLDPDQKLAVELMMAENAEGRWAARTTGRAEPRQNGKGEEIEVVESWVLAQRGEWIVHTAHEIPTAVSAHRRLVGLFESHRDLRRKLGRVGSSHSDRSIAVGDGIVVYRTRTAGGGRGLDDISRVVIDEAQHANPDHLASSLPILAANPNPQTNFIGTGGLEGVSDWWWTVRLRALKDDPGDFSYLEHSAERVELNQDGHVLSTPPDPGNREAWYRANLALGSRIEEEFLEEQLRNLGPERFCREHLCVWDPYPNEEGGFLPAEEWGKLKIDPPESLVSVSYGLSVVGGRAAVGSAGRLPTGDLYVDTVRDGAGTDWVVDYLADLWERKKTPVCINPDSGEGALKRALEDAGVGVVEVSARQYRQACGEVLDSIKNGTIRHLGQSSFDRAVRAVQRRDVGKEGAWVWADSQVDLTPLKAATLALTGVATDSETIEGDLMVGPSPI